MVKPMFYFPEEIVVKIKGKLNMSALERSLWAPSPLYDIWWNPTTFSATRPMNVRFDALPNYSLLTTKLTYKLLKSFLCWWRQKTCCYCNECCESYKFLAGKLFIRVVLVFLPLVTLQVAVIDLENFTGVSSESFLWCSALSLTTEEAV